MRMAWLSSVLLLLATSSSAEEPPIPVDQESHHKVVLKNDFVIAMHVSLAPDERTLYHTHSHDRAAVELTTSSITQQKVGEAEGPANPTKPGDLSVTNTPANGYSHRVHNVGSGTFEVFDVEFLQRPETPSDDSAGPVAGENSSARAYYWRLAPGAKTPEHTHHRPYLIVAATPMKLKMTAPDGQALTHEIKAGDFHWVDVEVTHTLTNDGTTPGEIVEFELK
jgi:quercetin dioxygenase-like cupin family protein